MAKLPDYLDRGLRVVFCGTAAGTRSATRGHNYAGDVRHGSIKRVASAVAEGAMAVALIHKYLSSLD